MERLTLQPGAAASIDEYLEYKRIVGEDDGGKLFTPEEYEQYKKKILPIRLQNRLYVSWRSPTGMDCKLVGPETPCFCTHRYKQHKTDFEVIPKERPIPVPCKVSQCPCKCYNFVPLNGTQPIRCRCKHFADQHSAGPGFPCNTCSKCSGFHSCFTCGCGQPAYAHETVVETKEERLAQGKPVGQDVPFAAMGGLTGFSSLAEGYMRLDDSGIVKAREGCKTEIKRSCDIKELVAINKTKECLLLSITSWHIAMSSLGLYNQCWKTPIEVTMKLV
ncbi:protein FAM221A isoform X3 [Varanus komodoensis]|uniref:protein FAM221A isoform X3 n=1 Tax=Varanus komodoensis TaxID=61221 RepID=UPI001CF7A5CC|nr:protein FAM221A isoform X3 [Varanus komodoensis]